MANHISHASLPYPIKNARYTIPVPYLDADGDPTDPTTPDTEISQDGGAYADAAEEVTTITGSNGSGYITLTGSETNNSLVFVAAKVASGPKATLAILQPRNLPILESGTASAGAAGSITFASGTYTGINLTGCFVRTTGGTGGGGTGGANNQARRITSYNTSTRVATVTPNWETTPDNTTTYDILLPEGISIPMLTSLSPTVLARTLDVSSGGEAGLDWSNIGSPTTTVNLSGTTISTVGSVAAGGITASSIAADAIGASELAADAIAEIADAVWDEVRSGHVTAGTFGEYVNSNVTHYDGVAGISYSGVPQVFIRSPHQNTSPGGNTSTTFVLDTSASSVDDYYNGSYVMIIDGGGYGQVRLITDYVGSTRTCTVDTWVTTPGARDYIIIPGYQTSSGSAPTAAAIADAVWDEARSGHVAAGTFGEYVLSNITLISGDSSAADNLEAAYDGTGYAHTGNTYPWTAAWDAEVQSEVSDALIAHGVPQPIRTGTAQAGASNSITLDASASSVNNFYRRRLIRITGGTGIGQSAICSGYNGTTKLATVFPDWVTTPDNTSQFSIEYDGISNVEGSGGTGCDFVATYPGQFPANLVGVNGDSTGLSGFTSMIDAYETNGYISVNTIRVGGTVQTARDLGQGIPNAVPGAAGGLLIAGSNAPTTFTGSGSSSGLTITGGSSALSALTITGGSTSGGGIGITTTNGDGFRIDAAGFSTYGLYITSGSFGQAVCIKGGSNGSGLIIDAPQGSFISSTEDQPALLIYNASTDPSYAALQIQTNDSKGHAVNILGGATALNITATDNTGTVIKILGAGTSTNGVLIESTGRALEIDSSGASSLHIGGTMYVATNEIAWNPAWDAEVQSECADALTAYSASTLTAAAAADAVWDEARSGHVTAGTFGEYTNANTTHFGGSAGVFYSGSPQVIHRYAHQNVSPGGNTSTTFVLDSSASSVDDFYNGMILMILSGAGHAGQTRVIKDYVGSTRTCTVDAWITTPTERDYVILPNYGIPFASTGTQFTSIPWNAAWDAEVQSEVQDGLEANNLDHLVKIAVDTDFASTVHLNSVVGHLADNGTSPSFNRTSHSLEAIVETSISPSVIADAVWDESRAAHTSIGSFGEYTNANLTYMNDAITGVTGLISVGNAYDSVGYLSANVTHFGGVSGTFNAGRPSVFTNLIRYNTAQAGASGSITLDAGASSVTDFYKNTTVYIVSGTGAGQHSVATAYNGTTKVLSVSPSWTVTPDNTSVFALSGIWANSGSSSITESSIATEIFTKLLTDPDFSTSGSFGKLIKDNLNATVSSRAVPGDAMTLTSNERGLIADKFLVRNLATGFDGGTNTVRNALRPSVNLTRFDVPSYGKYTVYEEDGITPAFIGTYSRGPSGTGPLESSGAD